MKTRVVSEYGDCGFIDGYIIDPDRGEPCAIVINDDGSISLVTLRDLTVTEKAAESEVTVKMAEKTRVIEDPSKHIYPNPEEFSSLLGKVLAEDLLTEVIISTMRIYREHGEYNLLGALKAGMKEWDI